MTRNGRISVQSAPGGTLRFSPKTRNEHGESPPGCGPEAVDRRRHAERGELEAGGRRLEAGGRRLAAGG
jgi:hypothetical protein